MFMYRLSTTFFQDNLLKSTSSQVEITETHEKNFLKDQWITLKKNDFQKQF